MRGVQPLGHVLGLSAQGQVVTLVEIARSLRTKAADLPDEEALELLIAAEAVEAVAEYQLSVKRPRSRQIEAESRVLTVGSRSP